MNQCVNFFSNSDCQLSVIGDQAYPAYELRNIVRFLDKEPGFSREPLLEHIGLTPDQLAEPYIPAFKMVEAMKYCSIHFGPHIGALIGATYQADDIGVFGYAVASSQNLGHAMELESKYFSLLGNLLKRGVTYSGQEMLATLYNVQNLDTDALSFFVALSNSSRMHIARRIFGDDITYNKVTFTFDDEANQSIYEKLYGCHVEFNSEHNSWSLNTRLFSRKRQLANHADSAQYLPYCNELLETLKQKNSLVNDIQQILISCAGDYPDIEMLASAFNVSSRTLRRQLANLGTSYQKILNKVRCQLSIEYLTHTDINIEDISNLIGFSDVTNFRHAFKKWVGNTPSHYRKTYRQPIPFQH